MTGYSLVTVVVASAHPGLHHDIERISEALTKSPARVDLLIKRGRLHRLDGNLSASLADLDWALRIQPADPDVALQRGLTLSGMGRDKEAVAELTRHILTGNATSVAYAERGRVHARRGGPDSAIADYTASLARKPTVEIYRARARLQVSSGDLDEAAAGLRDGLSKLGGAVVLRDELISIETDRKRFDAALVLIDDVLSRVQVKTAWYLRRADVLKAAGKAAAARQNYDRALSEANRVLKRRATAIHLCSRAKVFMALGRDAEAVADLRAALAKAPRFAEALRLLDQFEQKEKSEKDASDLEANTWQKD